jgi:hypothetical protein
MNTFADVLFEMELRQENLRSEVEQIRWARQAAGARVGRPSLDGVRRAAVQMGDVVAGLRCRLRSRFAVELDAAAC